MQNNSNWCWKLFLFIYDWIWIFVRYLFSVLYFSSGIGENMSRRRNGTNQAMVKLGFNRYKLGVKKKNTGKDFVYSGAYANKENKDGKND